MAHADREDQERNEQPERIDAVAEQDQGSQLPGDRDDGAADRHEGDAERLAIQPDGKQGQQERDRRKQHDRERPLRDVPHHLGKADDVHFDASAAARAAAGAARRSLDRSAHLALQVSCHPDGIHRAAVRVLFQDRRADERPGEVVGDQAAHDAGLENVVAHPCHAGRRRLEVGGNDVARLDAVFDHLEIADVGREQGLHAAAVDAVHHHDLVGRFLQRREEFRLEHVAVGGDEGDEHAVRAAEFRDVVLEVRAHVLVLPR